MTIDDENSIFDYLITTGFSIKGFIVKDLRSDIDIKASVMNSFNDIKINLHNQNVDKVYIIYIIEKESYNEEVFWLLRHTSMRNSKIKLSAGSIEYNEFNKSSFLNILSDHK